MCAAQSEESGVEVATVALPTGLAVSNNAWSEVVELDGRTGHQVRRIAVDSIPVVRGLYQTAKGLVVVGDDRAAVIDATGSADEFRLPGLLIAAPDVASSR